MSKKTSVKNLVDFINTHSINYRNQSLGFNLTSSDNLEISERTMDDYKDKINSAKDDDDNDDLPENESISISKIDKKISHEEKEDLRLRFLR